MGLKGDGGYNSEDYAFTRSFTDSKERGAALVKEVKQRLRALGPSGLYKLFWNKTVRTFGSGTYNQSDFLDDNPEQLTWLHGLLLGSGKDYPAYCAVCQVIFWAILALMALSCLQEVLGRKQKETLVRGIKGSNGRAEAELVKRPAWCCMAPQVAVLALVLFFAGWETSGRYITNYIPIILLSAVMGIGRWSELVGKIME